ncbi:MAG: alpha-amylase family glycosyl hydrolase [bacterium]|jgi:glycosidase
MFLLKKGLYFNLLIVLSFICLNTSSAQVVTLNPTFANQNQQVTVFFDASKGNRALLGQSAVYAHTGVITNLSSSATAWRHVQGNWGTDDAKVKMTNLGNNLFAISYSSIRNFYNVPTSENVLKLAFVFRNQSGSIVGREADGSDIFVEISDGSFQSRIETSNAQVLLTSEEFNIKAITSQKASLKLFRNGTLIQSIADDSVLNFNVPANTLSANKYTYVFEAFKNGNFFRDTIYMVYRTSPAIAQAPLGTRDGINYINDSTVILQLHAPFKEFIYIVGDFNNWEMNPDYYMKKSPSGQKFWLQINQLTKGVDYRFQYYIDKEQIKIADPYAEKLLDSYNDPFIPSTTYPDLTPFPVGKATEYVSVLNTGKEIFNWQHSNSFVKPAVEKLFIYELLARDFVAKHDFQTIKDTLDYLQKLGVNVIELMPVNEFEGNESWGYNPSFYFALDKYYGTKESFKAFVDECHRRGMAVVIDMVLNHSFGQSPMVRMYFDKATGKPTAQNPWFNQNDMHPFGVGYDFNHEAQVTKDFVDTVLKFWLTEYKVDGFRFDLSKGFTQKNTGTNVGDWGEYDAGRIAIWKRIYNKVRSYDANAYLILEHFAENSEEKELSDYGFMFWGNSNAAFNEATMGYISNSNLSGIDYKNRNWNNAHLVGYAESHDEERLMYKNLQFGNSLGSYNTKDLNTALKRLEAAMCFLIPLRGPKMIWQFGELGYDYSIDFNGRVGNKPIRWDYLTNANRKRVYDVVSNLAWLKNNHESYSKSTYVFNTGSAVKLYKVNDSTMNTVCVANFAVRTDSIAPVFQHTGWWYDFFSADSILVSDVQQKIILAPGTYKFYTDKKLNAPNVITGISTQRIIDEVKVYPNPVHQEINIEWKNKSRENLSIQLFDLTGRKVFEKNITNEYNSSSSDILIKVDEMHVNKGTYILKVNNGKETSQTKIIIL